MNKTIISIISIIGIAYASTASSEVMAQNDASNLRLSLSQVALYSETNRMDEAFSLIEKLKEEYPNNPQVLMAAADLNLKVENSGSAFNYINQAHNLDQLDEDILDRRKTALRDRSPRLALGELYKRTNQAKEYITAIDGKAFITQSVNASIILENDDLKSKQNIIRANGVSEEFDSSRQRGTVALSTLFANGDSATGMVHLGNESIGGGGELNFIDLWGNTAINANIAKPEWDFVETVVGNGTKDNIAVARKFRINPNWEANLAGGLNRYNLEDDSNVAHSWKLDFNLGYNHPFLLYGKAGDEITLGAAYSLGGEYFAGRENKIASDGTLYQPLPANSYEIHSFTVSAQGDITTNVSGNIFGGYAFDRFSSSGPLYGASVEYTPTTNLTLELLGSRGIIGESRTGKVDQLGVNLKFKW